jgi:TonB family protein
MSEAWSTWEGQVVNGEFHLQNYLGGSEQSVVYLAEYAGAPPRQAAIKLVPADTVDSDFLLSRWKIAEDLPHPHLMRVLQAGRCRLAAGEFLFLAMEYAEENLAQIVPERPLTPDEVRQMLDPVLDALSCLHGCGLVHGSVRPGNILAVHDQLKLSTDNLGKVGDSLAHYSQSDIYTPPESRYEAASPAGDVWSLGITLAEVLTQHLPRWSEQEQDDPELPAGLPAEFYEIVRGCLRGNPADRLTIGDIRSRLRHDLAPVAATAQNAQQSTPSPAASLSSITPRTDLTSQPVRKLQTPPSAPTATTLPAAPLARTRTRPLVPGIIATVAVLALALILALWALSHRQPESSQAAGEADGKSANSGASASPSPDNDEKPSPTRSQPRNRAPANGDVVQQQLPDVSRSARDTIHGTVRVNVKVRVDRTGSVVGSAFDHAGPSKYFARLAIDAAHSWKFTPSGQDGTREFVLHFEFTNGGTRAFAVGEKG